MSSDICCPHCGKRSLDRMLRDASVYFYRCLSCNVIFKPRTGDRCVYGSYGAVHCPYQQERQ